MPASTAAGEPTRALTAKGQQTRDAIEESARKLFAERGFHGTTLADITSAAGKSPAVFYRYFADKEDLLAALLKEWASYLAYIVSFATIGALWFAHVAVTDRLVSANAILMRINLLLLLVVSFVPFPTRLLSAYIGQDSQERVAATAYVEVFRNTPLVIQLLAIYLLVTEMLPDSSNALALGLLALAIVSMTAFVLLELHRGRHPDRVPPMLPLSIFKSLQRMA